MSEYSTQLNVISKRGPSFSSYLVSRKFLSYFQLSGELKMTVKCKYICYISSYFLFLLFYIYIHILCVHVSVTVRVNEDICVTKIWSIILCITFLLLGYGVQLHSTVDSANVILTWLQCCEQLNGSNPLVHCLLFSDTVNHCWWIWPNLTYKNWWIW